MTNCPPPETIDDLMANRLPAEQADQIRAHVGGCPACQQRLRGETLAPPPEKYPFLSPPRGPDELGWLGPYCIRGLLGEGGMSIVFDAEEPLLHRRVALKVLKPDVTDDVTRERFLREARALASLPSEHVVHLYAVGEDNGVPYFAMELLRGESLADRLKRDRWLPVYEALRIAREAAEGLAVLQQRGMVHRDVKPENLWLESDDAGRFLDVKLIDFGIARPPGGSGLTQIGQFVGTPAYVAPEQAVGNPVDGRADLYALGCVLYRMVTGHVPFAAGGPDTVTILQAVIKGEAPKVQDLAPHLSPQVAELIQQLMQPDPDNRPPNAATLVVLLRRLEEEERTAASKTKLLQTVRTGTHTRRTPRPVQFAGLILGGLAVAAALLVGALAIYYKFWSVQADVGGDKNNPDLIVPPRGEPIKVGVLFSQKGTTREHEQPIIDAVVLAIEEINNKDGVLGRPVVAVIGDGASDDERFAQEATRLIDTDGVVMIVGCWTSAARRRVTEVCAARDRLLFYPPGDEGLEVSPNLVYLGGTPNQTIVPLVRYLYFPTDTARRIKGRRKFFLLGSESVYSYAVNEILAHEVKKHLENAEVVDPPRYLPLGADKSDVRSAVAEIKKSGADCVIVSVDGVSTNDHVMQALRAEKLQPPAMVTAWLTLGEAEMALLPEALEGDFSAACYFESSPSPANQDFLKRFRAKYGKSRQVNDAMQTAYAGVYLWKKAVEKAGATDTAAVRKALPGLSVESPAGPMTMADNLHAYRTARVGCIEYKDRSVTFRVVFRSPEPIAPEPFPEWRTVGEWKEWLKDPSKGGKRAGGKSK